MCGFIDTSGTPKSNDPVMDALEAEVAKTELVQTHMGTERVPVIQRPENVPAKRAEPHPDAQPDQDANVRGLRFNKGKNRLDLLPVEPILALGRLLTKGAAKYAERNWEKGMPYKDAIASLERHYFAWKAGEDNDPETGENHLVHVMCNAMFLFVWQLRGVGVDDRVK